MKGVVGLTIIPTVVFTAAFLSVLWEFGYQVSKRAGGGGSWMTSQASWMVIPWIPRFILNPLLLLLCRQQDWATGEVLRVE